MQRDINKLRDLETGDKFDTNQDIIRKKKKIKEILLSDPDIKEVLGTKNPKPLNKFVDKYNPTESELARRKEIEEFNKSITHEQIVEWIKLNGIQKEVLNFILFDIFDDRQSYDNPAYKRQILTFMCLVHEADMQTEYDIPRTDLLGYLIKDLFNRSNVLGVQLLQVSDTYEIVDDVYYGRTIQFSMSAPNGITGTGNNKYDRFRH